MNATSTLSVVRNWPVDEQLEFVFQLWDQIIDSDWQPPESPELLTELRRRLDAYDADPSRALTWDEVIAHVKRAR